MRLKFFHHFKLFEKELTKKVHFCGTLLLSRNLHLELTLEKVGDVDRLVVFAADTTRTLGIPVYPCFRIKGL